MSKIRLVCPRCAARYDVPPEVIPPEGRDVQCSNCTHTWFQSADDVQAAPSGPSEPAAAAVNAGQADAVRTGWSGAGEVDVARPNATPVEARPAEPAAAESHGEFPDDPDDDEAGRATPRPVQPRSLPPEVSEVFRQEREHETRRRAQTGAIESQPDLGLPDPPDDANARRALEARERMAFVRTEDPASPPPAFVASGSRRDLLPDVEAISETLRGSDRHARPEGERQARRGRPEPQGASRKTGPGGFLHGFVLALALGAIAAAVYVYAPQIIDRQPEAEALLRPYVDAVDDARLWLDGAGADLRAALERLSS